MLVPPYWFTLWWIAKKKNNNNKNNNKETRALVKLGWHKLVSLSREQCHSNTIQNCGLLCYSVARKSAHRCTLRFPVFKAEQNREMMFVRVYNLGSKALRCTLQFLTSPFPNSNNNNDYYYYLRARAMCMSSWKQRTAIATQTHPPTRTLTFRIGLRRSTILKLGNGLDVRVTLS